ncbi:anti-sigma regulatory factor [Amycolatopsis sp. NBRC 101858]|uniref:sensor histidine kinase n=1 Tax=Amycolatopsis sp. NBRC 101858 TaxID=3032200 RepID=UPI0024A11BA1|nr:sensor histidine kinase [Amycolatopsis sp. NBRC 101858]GLY39777.1 anti-sigma regulatory factor [Amycolatopsis sp. NBRC 101858]
MSASPFAHPALFYRDDAEYLTGTVPFVWSGLAAGEPVAVAVPGRNLELLRRELGADAGRVRLLDMTDAGRNPGRIIPRVLRAFADAHPGPVRIIGEPVWAERSAVEYPACVQHEALINSAFAGRDVTILCPYDVARLDPAALADAEATHPVVIDGAGRRPSSAYDPDDVLARYNRPLPPASDRVAELPDTTNLAAARAMATTHAAAGGLSAEQVSDVLVVVTELLSNSVEHGSGTGTVRLWSEGGEFVCEVHDGGKLTDPLAGRRPATPEQRRGRGLLLVNYLADLVRLHTGDHGTTFRAYFRT